MAVAGVATVATLSSVGMAVPAAFAASPNGQTYTETDNVHGVFYEPEATNPCTHDTFNGGQGVQFTGNVVNHITAFTNSDEAWFTFTETGKVVGIDDGNGVTYTGKATVWGNGNFNERNQNSEFTFTVHLAGSDGSSVTGHETTVFVNNGNGVITVSFDKINLTCG